MGISGLMIILVGTIEIEDNGNVRGMNREEMDNTLYNLNLMVKQIGARIRIIRVYNGGIGHVCTVRLFLPLEEYLKKV